MNKVEILGKVKAQVEEKGTIRHEYINDEGCMCAVGYVLAECGVSLDVLRDDYLMNGTPIVTVAHAEPTIMNALEEHGIRLDDVRRLQSANDGWKTPEARNEAVIKEIDELIAGE